MVTAGVYLLHRTDWLFALTPDVLLIVAWIGAFTALLAAVLACVQDDIKRVLAYSTVSQLGYMMAAIGAGFSAAGFLHLLTHGLFKALLFLGAGAVIHAVGSNDLSRHGRPRAPDAADRDRLHHRDAVARGHPVLWWLPLEGRDSRRGWAGGLTGPFVLLMLVAFLTAFYMFRVVFLAFFAAGRRRIGTRTPGSAVDRTVAHAHRTRRVEARTSRPHAHEPPATMLLPLWVLALMSHGGRRLLRRSSGEDVARSEHETPPGWLTPAAVASRSPASCSRG